MGDFCGTLFLPVFRGLETTPGWYKGRVVIDIRAVNKTTMPDAYPVPSQEDILCAVQRCRVAILFLVLTVAPFSTSGELTPVTESGIASPSSAQDTDDSQSINFGVTEGVD